MHVASTWQNRTVASAAPQSRDAGRGFTGWRLWGVYLFLAAALVPVLKPVGPAQFAIVDAINMLGMLVFAMLTVVSRTRFEAPLLVPVMIISAGSLFALTNAVAVGYGIMTMLQDAYLYLWFIVVVNVLRARGVAHGFRVVWVWTAVVTAMAALAGLLASSGQSFGQIFGAKGERAVGLFYGPNSLADYLMMSVFIALSLVGQSRRLWLWGSIVLITIGLIATKSNGALGSLLAGGFVWLAFRAYTRSRSRITVVAVTLLLLGGAAVGWQAASGSGLLKMPGGAAANQTLLGRLGKSTQSREQIWDRLVRSFERTPMGIGPGNSKFQMLGIADRERKHSYMSKEAHNDYLGYAIERGPLGLIGLLLLIAASTIAVWSGWLSSPNLDWRAGVGGAIAAAMLGGLVASSVHSLVMEKLHFRHFWLFMAMLWAFRPAPVAPSVAAVKSNGKGSMAGVTRRPLRLGRAARPAHN